MRGLMRSPGEKDRRRLEGLSREALQRHQLARLNQLLESILPTNRFYAKKLAGCSLPLKDLDQLSALPLTSKQELATMRPDGLPANLTYDPERYVRFHQTSGTRGGPMMVLDTPQDWQWWIDCWQYVLDAAEIGAGDRALLAFSFGPFIGFWSAFDALTARGVMAIPGGGLGTLARLKLLERSRATALFCTPSYALRMAELAFGEGIDAASLNVRRVVVAGEPGGSVPALRARIEEALGATVIDHSGATEVGAWGFGDAQNRGLHVMESEFIAEFFPVDPADSGRPAKPGELAQLVLTSLGRTGCPVIRYPTGDLVQPRWTEDGPNRFVLLQGGVLGRVDDMMIIRGVNIFPSSVEQILWSFPEVIEFRMTARKQAAMDELVVEVEDRLGAPERIARELQLRLGLSVQVEQVAEGSLPRFEGKGNRFVDERPSYDHPASR